MGPRYATDVHTAISLIWPGRAPPLSRSPIGCAARLDLAHPKSTLQIGNAAFISSRISVRAYLEALSQEASRLRHYTPSPSMDFWQFGLRPPRGTCRHPAPFIMFPI